MRLKLRRGVSRRNCPFTECLKKTLKLSHFGMLGTMRQLGLFQTTVLLQPRKEVKVSFFKTRSKYTFVVDEKIGYLCH